jgi:hypothetical protein
MCKKCFKMLEELRYTLNEMEADVRRVGHIAGPGVNMHIAQALEKLTVFRESLWIVDKALKNQSNRKPPPTS